SWPSSQACQSLQALQTLQARCCGGGSVASQVLFSAAEATEAFRRRAAPELTAAAHAAGTGANTETRVAGPHLRELLNEAAEEEGRAFSDSQASLEFVSSLAKDTEELVTLVSELEAHRRERQTLKVARADCLAVGFQNPNAENQEFAALIVCATAGIFAVSIHFSFFSLFGLGYYVYRRSTRTVRKQHAASDDLGEITERLREVETLSSTHLAIIIARAEAWKEGRTE
ncbi:unnamed protein product, partial [Polarella glacialis]